MCHEMKNIRDVLVYKTKFDEIMVNNGYCTVVFSNFTLPLSVIARLKFVYGLECRGNAFTLFMYKRDDWWCVVIWYAKENRLFLVSYDKRSDNPCFQEILEGKFDEDEVEYVLKYFNCWNRVYG